MSEQTEGVWKWVAAILAAIMLAGLPGYIQLLRGPSATDVTVIRDRQQDVLQRLAVLEAEVVELHEDQAEIAEQIQELQELIRTARR